MADRPSRGWMMPTWWAIAFGGPVWLLCVGLSALQVATWSVRQPHPLERHIGAAVGGVLTIILFYAVSLVIGAIASRNRNVVSATFLVLGVIFSLSQVLLVSMPHVYSHGFAHEMQSISEGMQARQRHRLQAGEAKADLKGLEQVQKRMKEVTSKQSGDEKILGEVSIAMVARVTQATKEYQEALNQILQRNILTPTWVAKRKDLADARTRVAAFRRANSRLRQVSSFPLEMVQEEFAKRGIRDPSMAKEFVRSAQSEPKLDGARRLRALDEKFADELDQACDFLDKHWGEWRVDEKSGQLTMGSAQTHTEWMRILSRATATGAEEAKLQRKAFGIKESAYRKTGD